MGIIFGSISRYSPLRQTLIYTDFLLNTFDIKRQVRDSRLLDHPSWPLCLSPVEPKHCRGYYTNNISSLLWHHTALMFQWRKVEQQRKLQRGAPLRKQIERQWALFIRRPLWTSVTPRTGCASRKSWKYLFSTFENYFITSLFRCKICDFTISLLSKHHFQSI